LTLYFHSKPIRLVFSPGITGESRVRAEIAGLVGRTENAAETEDQLLEAIRSFVAAHGLKARVVAVTPASICVIVKRQ
jgi:hypothetical protein